MESKRGASVRVGGGERGMSVRRISPDMEGLRMRDRIQRMTGRDEEHLRGKDRFGQRGMGSTVEIGRWSVVCM